MHREEGPKWSKIVQRLPNRTVSSVRNRWQRIEKGRKLRAAGMESKNRCHACGQPKRGHVCWAKLQGGPKVRVPRGARRSSLRGRRADAPPLLCPQVDIQPPVAASLRAHQGVSRTALQIASQIGNPSVVKAINEMGAAPALRRGRSKDSLKDLLKSTHAAESFHGADSSMFTAPASNAMFTVNVDAVSAAQPPMLARSNTSFFKNLADTEHFSPTTRAFFDGLTKEAAGPAPPAAAPVLVRMVSDDRAPPMLRRAASGEAAEIPKLTRSVSSYINALSDAVPPLDRQTSTSRFLESIPSIDPADLGLSPLAQPGGALPPALNGASWPKAGPPLERRRSSRLSVSDLLAE